MAKSAKKFLARLKPLNARKGHVVKIYMIGGNRFYVERGWYEVDAVLAEKLRPLTQIHGDDDSPPLFDVCTQEEAEQMEQAEIDRAEAAKASAARPAMLVNTRARPSPRQLRAPEESPDDATDDDGESGDLTAEEVRNNPPSARMIDPAEDEDPSEVDTAEGRVVEVGRVAKPAAPAPPRARERIAARDKQQTKPVGGKHEAPKQRSRAKR